MNRILILSEERSITQRGSDARGHRATVRFEEGELVALMWRYGVARGRQEALA